MHLPSLRLALALAVLAGTAASALDPTRQPSQYGHATWDAQDGLPQNTVQALLQTRDGYLWVGTQEGLVRFDGVRFTVYDARTTPAIRAMVYALAEDADGTLWAGTAAGLVRRGPAGDFQLLTRADGLLHDQVRALAPARGGGLWVGSQGGLTLLKDGRMHHVTRAQGLAHDAVNAVREDAGGAVWVATLQGLSRVAPDGRVTTYGEAQGVPRERLQAVLVTRAGDVVVGTEGSGLRVRRADADGPFTHLTAAAGGLPSDKVRTLYEDAAGALWVGTVDAGLARRGPDGRWSSLRAAQGLGDDEVIALHEDREGSLWVGTFTAGLHQLRDARFTPLGRPEGLVHDVAWSVREDTRGRLWVGTSGGVSRLGPGGAGVEWSATELAGRPVGHVWALHAGPDGSVWLGTNDGLVRLSPDGSVARTDVKPVLGSAVVQALLHTRDGSLWVGTPAGVGRLSPDGQLEAAGARLGLPVGATRRLVEDVDGGLWVGVRGVGVVRVDAAAVRGEPGAPAPRVWGRAQGLSGDTVYDVHRDAGGAQWLATDGGLDRLEGERVTRFGRAVGMPEENLHRVLEDAQGWLWLSTNRGILRVERAALEAVARGERARAEPTSYGTADGMRSAECNGTSGPAGWRARDGRLWFPTLRGVVAVDPARLAARGLPPPVHVEGVVVDGQPLPHGGAAPLQVAPGSRALEVAYTGLSLVNPARVRFQYRLEGYDPDWVEAGPRRTAYYTNLPPGAYTFRVRAASSEGPWSERPAEVQLVLAPRFHQTLGFRVLAGLGVVALVAGVALARVRLAERRARALAVHNAELARALATAQEAVRLKSEFVANTSHELRTPLNALLNLPEGLLELVREGPGAGCAACGARFALEAGERLAPDARCPDCGAGLTPRPVWRLEGADAETVARGLRTLLLAGRHLRRVVDDVLDFSKLEAGGVQLRPEAVELAGLLEEVAATLAPAGAPRGVVLEVDAGPPGLGAWADRVKLAQVLLNLGANAVKFSPEGGRVLLAAAPLPGGGVALRVRDAGPGIAPEHHALIFESFRQLDGGHTRKAGGTGLGLTITQRLVHLHGGSVRVESELGKGATFVVELPPKRAVETPGEARVTGPSPSGRGSG